jgi:hypothetical protein
MKGNYSVHPACAALPVQSAEKFSELVDNIIANGLINPIKAVRGQIIDGRHRMAACEQIGVEPTVIDLDYWTEEQVLASIYADAKQWKTVSKSQLACWHVQFVQPKNGSNQYSEKRVLHDVKPSVFDVSTPDIAAANYLRQHDPAMFQRVMAGELPVRKARALSEHGTTVPPQEDEIDLKFVINHLIKLIKENSMEYLPLLTQIQREVNSLADGDAKRIAAEVAIRDFFTGPFSATLRGSLIPAPAKVTTVIETPVVQPRVIPTSTETRHFRPEYVLPAEDLKSLAGMAMDMPDGTALRELSTRYNQPTGISVFDIGNPFARREHLIDPVNQRWPAFVEDRQRLDRLPDELVVIFHRELSKMHKQRLGRQKAFAFNGEKIDPGVLARARFGLRHHQTTEFIDQIRASGVVRITPATRELMIGWMTSEFVDAFNLAAVNHTRCAAWHYVNQRMLELPPLNREVS